MDQFSLLRFLLLPCCLNSVDVVLIIFFVYIYFYIFISYYSNFEYTFKLTLLVFVEILR